MPRTSRTSVFINSDREQVFNHVKEFTKMAEWRGDQVKIEKVTPGILGIGSRFKVEAVDGKPAAEIEVTDYEFPLRFAYKAIAGKSSHEHIFDFHLKESGKQYEETVTSRGPLLSTLMPRQGLAAPASKKALETLKARMEQPVSTETIKSP